MRTSATAGEQTAAQQPLAPRDVRRQVPAPHLGVQLEPLLRAGDGRQHGLAVHARLDVGSRAVLVGKHGLGLGNLRQQRRRGGLPLSRPKAVPWCCSANGLPAYTLCTMREFSPVTWAAG